MAGKSVDIASVLGAQLRDVPKSGTAEMQWISTERIVDNALNFYPRPTNTALGDLMESIEANGLLEPPTVIQNTGTLYYRLISGHSRMEAVRMLQHSNPTDERWQKVLCRVLPQMDKDQELAAVIEANRQRIKSGALLAREAESLTAAYIRRREAGEDLPGRIRDRVAEALQINKTKLSNLKVIKDGLKVPGFHRLWEEEKITESAALEIARMDLDAQYRLLDWHIDKNRELTLAEVKKFKTIWTCCVHKCPGTAGLCPNAEQMYSAFYRNGEWHCPGCCKQCLKKDTCAKSCEFVEKKPQEVVKDKRPENPALHDPRLDWRRIPQVFCGRVSSIREQTGLSRKEFAESIGEYPGTYSSWENASLPGSERVPRLAVALGVSTDYLYGLTDDPTPQTPAPAGWQPLDKEHWPPDGALVVLSAENALGGNFYQLARCAGSWADQYPFFDPNSDLTVRDFEEYGFDRWMSFEEARREKD